MGNLLRLGSKDTASKLSILSIQLSQENEIPFELRNDMPLFKGVTYYDDNGFAVKSVIGTNAIAISGIFSFLRNKSVSDKDFTTAILNMHHEATHVWQKNELFRQKHLDPYTANQLVQEIACMDNHDYYFNNGNYKINANEIQAEKEGIINTYQYLCDEFPEVNPVDHEHIILDIVNDKMLNSTYFINSSTPFKSLSEVEKAFDDAYDISFTKKRTYMVNSNTHDAVKLFMQDHPAAKEVYLNADSPLEQDRCIAAINLKLHPEWIEAYPALSDMDLSYENIIEKPYQQTQASRIEKIHNMFGDVLADNKSDNELEI